MNKDAPATPAAQPGGSMLGEIVQSMKWKRALLVGALLGMALGVLNLAAIANHWPLDEWFEALDTPVSWLVDFAQERFDFLADPRPGVAEFYTLLLLIGYWTIIGLLLAVAYLVARAGVFKRILRDRTCWWVLLLATAGGALIGLLNFIVVSSGDGPLTRCFETLDQPGISLVETLAEHTEFVPELLHDGSDAEVTYELVAAIVYWVTISLFWAMLFCVVRVLRMRKDAGDTMLPAA